MTNAQIINRAMRQSAIDSSCFAEDFTKSENIVVLSRKQEGARKYLELPFACDLTSYGSNIVASVSDELMETVKCYISRFPIEHCFETPNLHVLIDLLKPFGLNICYMAEYFLPDMNALKPLSCAYEIRVLMPEDFAPYYSHNWSNALCEKRRHLDQLAAGAFDRGKLVGLAGCSADCKSMWQIGVDVLPEYRKQGIASCLTSLLARILVAQDIVPFYCCAWSNIGSARNAVKSGFKPAWVQVTAKKSEYIDNMNQQTFYREEINEI